MSSYLVLARKYRPKQFSDIVGQESVVRTLVNAIQLKRTHQAYIFSGSRGIGKTSIARIFSKALRCEQVKIQDGLLVSCDACADCIEIAAGNSMNVIEIDGASNNSVDNIREIRESARFLPSSGQYRIYIIDEVHMLSTAAFNALLKTLEEPPEHVLFIFATTESHKIPDTILGRCQRFEFKRVTVVQVVNRLSYVLKAEKIECEDAALQLIARASEGSMRDALSLLDQVIAFSGLKITAQAVRESIGLLGTERVHAVLSKVLMRDPRGALLLVQDAFNQGYDLSVLLRAMIEMLHAVVLFQVGVEKPETPFSADELKQIAALTPLRDLEENEMIFQVFHQGTDLLSRASQPKLVFDLLVIKAAAAEALIRRTARPTRADRPSESDDDEAVTTVAPTKSTAPTAPAAKQNVAPKPLTAEAFMAFVFAQKPMLGLILESVIEWGLPSKELPKLILSFREREKVKADQVLQKDFREQLAKLSESFFGVRPTVEAVLSQSNAESVAERNDRMQRETTENRRAGVMAIPAVQEARALFGAEITQLEWTDKGNA